MNKLLFISSFLIASHCFGTIKSHTEYVMTNQRELCPQIDKNLYTSFPGVKNDEDPAFSRNQDRAGGACEDYSTIDMLCKKLKDLGLWKDASGCSVADFRLNTHKKYTADNARKHGNTITDLLQWDTLYKDFLDYAVNVGFCPESRFPSEFAGNGGDLKDHYENLDKKTEANAVLPGRCKECEEIAPKLTPKNWDDVYSTVKPYSKNDERNYAALLKMNELSCPPSVRVKLPKIDPKTGKEFRISGNGIYEIEPTLDNPSFRLLQDILLEGEVAVAKINDPKILMGPKTLMRFKDDGSKHAVVITGAIIGGTKKKEKCFYVIKNSWGMNCADEPNFDTEDRMCDKTTGAVAISFKILQKNLVNLDYVTSGY